MTAVAAPNSVSRGVVWRRESLSYRELNRYAPVSNLRKILICGVHRQLWELDLGVLAIAARRSHGRVRCPAYHLLQNVRRRQGLALMSGGDSMGAYEHVELMDPRSSVLILPRIRKMCIHLIQSQQSLLSIISATQIHRNLCGSLIYAFFHK